MQKILIYAGVALVIIGLLWPYVSKIPFGRLPGDIVIEKPNVKIYFPLTTMILLSILLSLIVRFFRR
ncbi:hypothetical protein B6D60_11475 [candidate division KSB1 bacterium 4484_87]|nr:MAG: hypothetical protein B6D60_11475 [candidate division KSB1 bacterium 4484_87]